MMLRSRFTLLFPLWLAVLVAEPAVVHVCPAHDVAAGGSTATPHAHHGGGAAGSESTDTGHRPEPAPCTCIGACCASTPPALVASAETLPAATVALVVPATHAPAEAIVMVAPQTRLPFPNGPPAQPMMARA